MQYSAIKKVKKLRKKPIINYCIVENTNIIDKLFVIIEKRYDIQNNIKLVLFFESFSLEFNQRKAYIFANQNIILKKTAIFLANHKVQILRDYVTRLEIKVNTMTVKMK